MRLIALANFRIDPPDGFFEVLFATEQARYREVPQFIAPFYLFKNRMFSKNLPVCFVIS